MSELTDWLGARRPLAPSDLAEAVQAALAEHAVGRAGSADEVAGPTRTDGWVDGLTQAGARRLADALERPGRVRESAFRLLEADALLTYACEAALEADDPERALQRVLAAAAG